MGPGRTAHHIMNEVEVEVEVEVVMGNCAAW
jgi:hypothetical protein